MKERLLEFIAVTILKNDVHGKLLCLVGPPGIGKTSVARSMARALNRQFYHLSLSKKVLIMFQVIFFPQMLTIFRDFRRSLRCSGAARSSANVYRCFTRKTYPGSKVYSNYEPGNSSR